MSAVPPDLEFTKIHELVVKSRLVNHAAVDDLSARLRTGKYCLILGPRFSEKTFLLDDIAGVLRGAPDVIPIRINLEDFRYETGATFIRRLAAAIADAAGVTLSIPEDERQLVTFFHSVPGMMRRHVVILFDHLEVLPHNDITVLLRTLRGVFTEQRGKRLPFRLTCAAATSFDVAKLPLGPNSPFNEGHHHWVGDLTREESMQLLGRIARALAVEVVDSFFGRLFEVTSGDRYLIALLCNCCARIASKERRQLLTLDDLTVAEEWFLKHAEGYPPLQETIRALEEPDVLRVFTQVLHAQRIDENELEISGNAGADALRLTGGVRRIVDGPRTFYEARNELVRRFMADFYNPVRVARVLFMSGRVSDAVDYLERQPNMHNDGRLRRAFLDAVGSAINAALTVAEAVKNLARHFASAFPVDGAAVYIDSTDRGHMECLSSYGEANLDRDEFTRQRSAAVFRDGQYKMQHDVRRLTLALTSRNDVRFGIIELYGFEGDTQSDDFRQVVSVVRQIGWALGNVFERERLIRQLQTLNETGRQLSGSLDLERVLDGVVEAGVRAVPGAERGLLLLYDETVQMLVVKAHSGGYLPGIKEEVRLRPGEGYAGTVFKTGEPILINDATKDERVRLRNIGDVAKQKSAVCVPLLGWGRTIGVFVLDNITEFDAFRIEDQGLLSAFAAQAATALQNAMVYRSLYDLSIKVNRGALTCEDIFLEAARSIVHVTAAFAANLLLLRDVDDPERTLTSAPLMSVAYNLSKSFEKDVRPRAGGITLRVLQTGKASICKSPDEEPGIHPLALAEGVRALIALPLSVQEQIRGVMFVHFREPHDVSPDERSVLSIFANLCAEAIAETRHAEQLRVHSSVAGMGLDLSDTMHNIAQLIQPLSQMSLLLSRETAGNEKAQRYLAEIDKAIDTLAAVPNDLLPLDENIQDEDITRIVREQVYEWTRHKNGIDVDLTEVGSAAVHVKCDARRLGRVIKCLAENAVRAAANEKSRQPRIKVALRVDLRTADVVMSNNGDPIPPDIVTQLFKDRVRGYGRGVGLLIARAIVTRYDGDLELVSSSEAETVFRLSLPRSRREAENPDRR